MLRRDEKKNKEHFEILSPSTPIFINENRIILKKVIFLYWKKKGFENA